MTKGFPLFLQCIFFCNVALSSAPDDPPGLREKAQSIANDYVRTLNLTSWSMDLAKWISDHRYKEPVDTFREVDWDQWEFEKYCFKTRIEKNECIAEYSFFDNGDYLEPKPILQQILIFDRRTKRDNTIDEEVWKLISRSLTKMFGKPRPVPRDEMLNPFDLSALQDERKSKLWQDGSKRIILAEHFRWEGEKRTDFIVLLARERALDSLVHRFHKMQEKYGNSTLISGMCDSLRLTETPLSLFCQADGVRKNLMDDLVYCGEFISKAGRSGDSVHLPLYLMALYVFGQKYSPQDYDGVNRRDVDTLKRYNVVFQWGSLGEGWTYNKRPLVDIYTKYFNSQWGQLAFVMLQNAGWCLDGACNGNNGSEVVSKGEEFLKRYPECLYAPAIQLTIAKGHETNWNVSTCKIESPYMYDPNYRFDEDARLKAIRAYERILTAYPASAEAEIAKLRLPRLKLGINTGRTDYFFIYD